MSVQSVSSLQIERATPWDSHDGQINIYMSAELIVVVAAAAAVVVAIAAAAAAAVVVI